MSGRQAIVKECRFGERGEILCINKHCRVFQCFHFGTVALDGMCRCPELARSICSKLRCALPLDIAVEDQQSDILPLGSTLSSTQTYFLSGSTVSSASIVFSYLYPVSQPRLVSPAHVEPTSTTNDQNEKL